MQKSLTYTIKLQPLARIAHQVSSRDGGDGCNDSTSLPTAGEGVLTYVEVADGSEVLSVQVDPPSQQKTGERCGLDDGSYMVTVPALPGCVTQGESYEHAVEMAKEAIEAYLAVLIEDGDPIPQKLGAR